MILRAPTAQDDGFLGGGAQDGYGKLQCAFFYLPDFLNFVPHYLLLVTVEIILIVQCAWIYILTNERHTVLYVGVTNNLATRLWEHRSRSHKKSFTARYNSCKVIYYEGFNSIVEAIAREKFIKGKSRKWKEELIQQMNPGWNDLTGLVASW